MSDAFFMTNEVASGPAAGALEDQQRAEAADLIQQSAGSFIVLLTSPVAGGIEFCVGLGSLSQGIEIAKADAALFIERCIASLERLKEEYIG